MKDIIYILENLYQITKIPVRYFDKTVGTMLFRRGYDTNDDPISCDEALTADILSKLTTEMPVIHEEDGVFLYGSYMNTLDCVIAIGPVCLVVADRKMISQYAERHSVFSPQFYIKHRTIADIHSALSIIYFALEGKLLPEYSDMAAARASADASAPIQENEYRGYMLDNTEQEVSQPNFSDERDFMKWIRDGDVEGILSTKSSYNISVVEQKVGKLAERPIKKYEYLTCATITLATRAAIEGGLEPQTAYAIGELYLQRLENSTGIDAYVGLNASIILGFAEQVKKLKDGRNRSSYIEKCKSYIMSRLNKDFSLEDIADELKINKSYLSRRFSEVEGIGIKKYTQIKRVEVAANMLKYTDLPISEISNYLRFPSQSQLGICFREQFGMTPKKYRDQEQVVNIPANRSEGGI